MKSEPRFLRAKDAPDYLAMSRAEFNETVRPHVREFPIGLRGVGFDKSELDRWADEYVQNAAIAKDGAKRQQLLCSERQEGETKWREKRSPASRRETVSGTSTKKSMENEFTKALALVTGRKQSGT